MIKVLCVGFGGFIGAVMRYLISLLPMKNNFIFPVKTFIINIIGSFAIGLISALIIKYAIENQNLELFLKVGICGGFTTFSTYAFETTELIKNQNYFIGISYAFLSVALGILAVAFAQYIIK